MSLAQRLRDRQAARSGPSSPPTFVPDPVPTQDPSGQERPLSVPEWRRRRLEATQGQPLRAVRDETPPLGL